MPVRHSPSFLQDCAIKDGNKNPKTNPGFPTHFWKTHRRRQQFVGLTKEQSLRRWFEPPWPQCEATEGTWGATETGWAKQQVAKWSSLVHLNLIARHHAARAGTRPQTAMLPLAPSQLPLLQLHLPSSPPREALKRREKSNGLCSCKASRASPFSPLHSLPEQGRKS